MNYSVHNLLARLNDINMEHEKIFGDLKDLKKELIAYKNSQSFSLNNSHDHNTLIQSLHVLPFACFYIVDLNKNKIIYEKGLSNLIDFDINEQAYDEFFDFLHPDDLSAIAYVERELIRSANTEIERWNNYNLISNCRIKSKNGPYIKIGRNTSVLEIDKEGRPAIVLHLCNDLTDLVQERNVSYVLNIPGKRSKRVQESACDLTKRELQILKLIANGKSSTEIGNELFISRETVDKHRKNMIKKTGCLDTHKLAIKALNEKWI